MARSVHWIKWRLPSVWCLQIIKFNSTLLPQRLKRQEKWRCQVTSLFRLGFFQVCTANCDCTTKKTTCDIIGCNPNSQQLSVTTAGHITVRHARHVQRSLFIQCHLLGKPLHLSPEKRGRNHKTPVRKTVFSLSWHDPCTESNEDSRLFGVFR